MTHICHFLQSYLYQLKLSPVTGLPLVLLLPYCTFVLYFHIVHFRIVQVVGFLIVLSTPRPHPTYCHEKSYKSKIFRPDCNSVCSSFLQPSQHSSQPSTQNKRLHSSPVFPLIRASAKQTSSVNYLSCCCFLPKAATLLILSPSSLSRLQTQLSA